jgi:DNA-binding transcriptional ArsR family regulator
VRDAVEAAIAHPGRRELLRLVLADERPAGDLARLTGMSQPAASQHLKVLRDAGLVITRAEGPRRLYRVDPAGLKRLHDELGQFWASALDALKSASERGDWP